MSARHRAPSIASLACSRYAAQAARADPPREARVGGEPAQRVRRARPDRPGGTSSALSPSPSSSRAAGVSAVITGVPHASAWNDLVRDHALRLGGRPEDAERAARAVQLVRAGARTRPTRTHSTFGGSLRAAACSSWPLPTTRNADLGREPRGLEDRLQPVQRDQLADEERREVLRRRQPGGRRAPPRRRSRPRPALRAELARRSSACASVSATTRSASAKRRAVDVAETRVRQASRRGSGRGRRRACRPARRAG